MKVRTWLTVPVVASLLAIMTWQSWEKARTTGTREAETGSAPQAATDGPVPMADRGGARMRSMAGNGAGILEGGPPLPPRGTPLLAMKDELLARLEAGDVRAGCRLYHELLRCHQAGGAVNLLDMVMGEVATAGLAGTRERHDAEGGTSAGHGRQDQAASGICAGVSAETYALYPDVLRRSALLGDSRAMLVYAATAGSLGLDFVRDAELLPRWRPVAETLLYRSVRLGNPAALILLARARSGGQPLLGALLDDDAVEAAAARLVLGRLGLPGGIDAGDLGDLDGTQRERALLMADRLQSTAFAGVTREAARERAAFRPDDPDVAYCDRLQVVPLP